MIKRALLWATVVIGVAAGAMIIASQMSPWPSALFYRFMFSLGAMKSHNALAKHVPSGITARLNERYDPIDPDATLDVFYPSDIGGTDRALPTIVWVHGGGFIGGTKDEISNYLRILARKGYTVVGINYSVAPRRAYPTPVRQANVALSYISRNAKRLHIDTGKLFLAGDSAGAQIAAQLALVLSAPPYATDIGIKPSLGQRQLRGILLYCGFYEPQRLLDSRLLSHFVNTMIWSYFRSRSFPTDARAAQFSIAGNVTADFPPMFITVGNGDPLAAQSTGLAEAAAKRGVPVDSLFFPDDHEPRLPHEYQFNLDIDEGRVALDRTIAFLRKHSQ